ncbi:SDR family NAD(P)-dependent oxidoreductase [Paenibacillus glacialis]|uniref:3-ketoacyl-ACP reductase n=1 Tax=Paenibacillus glacialis TaxID=494026 RepID=A0A168F9T9_9BACL|nr:SDR family NAD(P)-dependent oxidoreductase [Paenibacillus glacialis]OAB35994.1 hypothetical protein PGLA_21450 [Paenibacillus glacialis]
MTNNRFCHSLLSVLMEMVAEQLSDLGAKVVINYSSSPERANEVVEGLKANGREAIAIHADISKVSDITHLFDEIMKHFGRIDILINNAGLMINKPLAEATEEDFDKRFSVNVKGTYFACQQALKHMESKGRIINFSTSVTGQMFPSYSIAKKSLSQLCGKTFFLLILNLACFR